MNLLPPYYHSSVWCIIFFHSLAGLACVVVLGNPFIYSEVALVVPSLYKLGKHMVVVRLLPDSCCSAIGEIKYFLFWLYWELRLRIFIFKFDL